MNISAKALEAAKARDGAPAEERPAHVDESLREEARVGWMDGLPVVEPSDDYETPKLGEPVDELYSHYIRGEKLLMPEAGAFLSRLFAADEIQSVSDAADEIQTSEETVRKAAELHGVDVPSPSSDDSDSGSEGGESSGPKKLRLPSGETLPKTLLADPPHEDKLVLSTLLSMGMGVGECAQYLSRETGERVTEADVRDAAQDCGLLAGGDVSSSSGVRSPPSEQTTASGPPYDTTPWD